MLLCYFIEIFNRYNPKEIKIKDKKNSNVKLCDISENDRFVVIASILKIFKKCVVGRSSEINAIFPGNTDVGYATPPKTN